MTAKKHAKPAANVRVTQNPVTEVLLPVLRLVNTKQRIATSTAMQTAGSAHNKKKQPLLAAFANFLFTAKHLPNRTPPSPLASHFHTSIP